MKVISCSTNGYCDVFESSNPFSIVDGGPLTEVLPKYLASGKDVELQIRKGSNVIVMDYIEARYFWLSLCRDEDLYQKISGLLKATDYLQRNVENAGEHEIVLSANRLRDAMKMRGRQM
jgi:hypothetical protein